MKIASQTQYAKMKGVSRQVVHNWLERGKLRSVYLPEIDMTVVEIPREEWRAWNRFIDRKNVKG